LASSFSLAQSSSYRIVSLKASKPANQQGIFPISPYRILLVAMRETRYNRRGFSNQSEIVTTSDRTRALRWLILALLFSTSVVTYIDRVNISVTARQMMPAFGLTQQEMGWVFSAFVVGYAIFQLPGGWLADRLGARLVLTCALIWWSLCTALTAFVAASPLADMLGIVGALALVRFALGLGEAVALPSFNRAVANWMPSDARGLGIGIAIGGIGLGSAITPPIAAWVMVNWRWQTVFYLSAGLGLLMAILWWTLARDRPEEHPWAPESSPADTPRVERSALFPRLLLQHPSMWWLVLSYSCLGYVAYVYLSWFYLYLVNVRGFDNLRGGLYASLPFWAILVGCPVGGWATDRLATVYGVTRGRMIAGLSGMAWAGVAIVAGAFAGSASLAIASLSLGAGCLYFAVGAYWASTSDLSKTHAGALSGLMNTGANLGGALSPSLTPWLAAQWGWPIALATAGAVALLGAVLWLKIDPTKSPDG
jgi:MFS transporter, ACS family, glucarate transporter